MQGINNNYNGDTHSITHDGNELTGGIQSVIEAILQEHGAFDEFKQSLDWTAEIVARGMC